MVGVSGASPHGAESNGVWCMGGCEPFFILLKSCFEHGKLLGNKKVSAREKTKHPTADSVSIRFSSTTWN